MGRWSQRFIQAALRGMPPMPQQWGAWPRWLREHTQSWGTGQEKFMMDRNSDPHPGTAHITWRQRTLKKSTGRTLWEESSVLPVSRDWRCGGQFRGSGPSLAEQIAQDFPRSKDMKSSGGDFLYEPAPGSLQRETKGRVEFPSLMQRR